MSEPLVEAITNMEEPEALRLAKELLDSQVDPMRILELCGKAMDIIGKRFENQEYFLPELILAGKMLSQIADMVKPKLTKEIKVKRLGKVIIGTVEGDIHDIGKNIVTFMLDVNGFEVHDLGIDVPVQRFIDAIKEIQPEVVGLSGFLTLAFDSMKKTIEAIQNVGLRNKVKIMIGGGQIDERVRDYTGADAYGLDAVAAVSLCKKWIGGQ
jgi:5-methyltetrahydrofolate--homocysteine methyltransferase